MRAAVYHGQRDVRVEAFPEPSGAVAQDGVRLRVTRVALCGTDVGEYAHGPHMIPLTRRHPGSGHLGPTVLGHEVLGEVVDVGPGVDPASGRVAGVAVAGGGDLVVGARVVLGAGVWCGTCAWCVAGRTNLCERYYTLGLSTHGGLTELLDAPAAMCRVVPAGCADDAAAMAQPLAVALHAVRRARVGAGDAVVLIGAGGIGLFVLAGLVAHGAHVVVIDVDEERLAAARRMGAAATLNARDPSSSGTFGDLTTTPVLRSPNAPGAVGWGAGELEETTFAALGGRAADVVLEASGAPTSPALAQRLTARGGRIMLVGLQAAPCELDLHDLVLREIDVLTSVAHVCGHDLPQALALLGDGRLAAEALDRVIPLEAIVDEGLEPLAAGRTGGKVLVTP
jgi:(R,R)-butanediol dehydrogenase/meso-butanediol dehydrogenase/diacetyl reductase